MVCVKIIRKFHQDPEKKYSFLYHFTKQRCRGVFSLKSPGSQDDLFESVKHCNICQGFFYVQYSKLDIMTSSKHLYQGMNIYSDDFRVITSLCLPLLFSKLLNVLKNIENLEFKVFEDFDKDFDVFSLLLTASKAQRS